MAENPNIVLLTPTPRALGSVPAPATGAPRNSADIRAMAQALLDMIAGGLLTASPTGAVVSYAGNAAPEGWLICDGRAVSRVTYAALFAVLGTRYGSGDGATTFTLPDLRGRMPVGAGQGTSLTNRNLGTTGGAETHALTIPELPSHSHTSPTANRAADGGTFELAQTATIAGGHTIYDYFGGAPTDVTGGNGAHNNMPPFLALNFIIRI